MIARARDRAAKWLIAFGVEVVATPRTGARLNVAFRRGYGLQVPEALLRRAEMEKGPGE